VLLVVDTEDDAILADAATERTGTFEFHHVARKWVSTHRFNGRHDPA
jgi:hypothetical protein